MSWTVRRLSEICEINLGKTPSRSNKLYWDDEKISSNIWISIADLTKLDGRYISDSKEYISDKGASLFRPVKAGTLLMSFKLSIGKLAYAGCDLYTNEAIVALPIKNKNEINSNFLYYYLQSYDWDKETENDIKLKGKTLNKAKLNEIKVPVPPLSTQQKIVEKLDAIFAEIDKASACVEANLKNVDSLFNSYCSYFFENYALGCETKSIGELCDLMTGGTPSSKTEEYYKDGTIPWLVSGDVNLEEIFDCHGRITQLGYENSSAKYLPVNSVLIALNGQGKTRGTVAMLRMKATCNQSLVSIYPKNEKQILPDLIYYILKSRYIEIRKLTGDGGNDRRGLNMPLIRTIQITYPKDINEQEKLVGILKALTLNIKSLKKLYRDKSEEIQKIKNSVLSLAFNGGLVKE